MEKNKKISLWDKVCFGLTTKKTIKSFEVYFEFKTKADMTLGVSTQKLLVDSDTAMKNGYIINDSWDIWNIIRKVKKNISKKVNSVAKESLEKCRKSRRIILNEVQSDFSRCRWYDGGHGP